MPLPSLASEVRRELSTFTSYNHLNLQLRPSTTKMSKPNPFLTLFRRYYTHQTSNISRTQPQCLRQRFTPSTSTPRTRPTLTSRFRPPILMFQRRSVGGGPGLDPSFVSILDRPAKMARSGSQHGPGLIILAIIPLTAFVLGCWQVQRLGWKTELVARFEDRLTFPPLELPLRIDESMLESFDYRRVYARGKLRHDQEMLIGPRILDGEEGYTVVTPLERTDARGTVHKILCCRGWIKKDTAPQWFRKNSGGLPEGEVMIEGLLRIPPKGNMFTPHNEPEKGKWFFPSVGEMAEWTGSQRVWVEETMSKSSFSFVLHAWLCWFRIRGI